MSPKKGLLITASIRNIKYLCCDEIWQITRSRQINPDIRWVPELAPSKYLYEKFIQEWKGKDPASWWPFYQEIFNRELSQENKKPFLRLLWKKLKSGQKIALVCFCPDHRYCHRTLVAQFFQNYGINTIEYIPETNQNAEIKQPNLFDLQVMEVGEN